VRECERLVSKALRDDASNPTGIPGSQGQPSRDHQRLEELLSDALSTPVSIKTSRQGGGTILIDFVDTEHFAGLMQRMGLSIL